MSNPTTLAISADFNSDTRRRYLGGILQRSAMQTRLDDMMDVSDDSSTPPPRESTLYKVVEHANFTEEKDQNQSPQKEVYDLEASISEDVLSDQPLRNQRQLQSNPRQRGRWQCFFLVTTY
jgi:hypothetical protein